jgi:hypothetical protein
MIDGIANTGAHTFVEKTNIFPIDIHLHVHSHSMRHSPHTERRRLDKALGIRLVPWFPTILSLLDVIIPEYNISSDPRHGAGTKKIPWIHQCDATYCLCLFQVSNFHA